jgi:hypothetical protein
MVIGVEPTYRERTSALLVRVWLTGGRDDGGQVVIRTAARADVESGEQQSALFGDVASACGWIEQWLSDVVTGFQQA